METNFVEAVLNPARLAALRRLGLLDTPAEAAFDRLARLAARVLKTPIALVTLVDDDHQFFKSCMGLPEPWATWRQTPMSHSFCQHVVTTHEPLIINDARVDSLFRDNLAIRDLGVVAYLGIPLKLENGEVLGSFCVIDSQPRVWTDDDVAVLQTLTCSVMTEIELRSEIAHRRATVQQLEVLNRQIEDKIIELEMAHADLESFSYTVSHDIRSPLSRIQNFCTLLREDCDLSGDGCAGYVEAIDRSVKGAADVLEGLSFLSGISKRPLARELVNVSELAQPIAQGLQKREPDRIAEFRIQDDLKVCADPYLMRVVLENLIGNAWKFTSKKEHASIEIGELSEQGQPVIFVRDNGAGFSMDYASKLFRSFTRLHGQEEFEGTGIGLGTVHKIITRHGGRIWAKAEVDNGATFFFQLPSTEHCNAPVPHAVEKITAQPPL